MSILYILIACILSAILYRAGGQGKDPASNPKWMPMWLRFSQARDAFCPLVLIGLSMLLFGIGKAWWFYLLCFGASWGALTTYWDTSPINWMKPNDNFYLHGFFCGLAGLFLIGVGIPWYFLVGRLVVCTLGMGIWSAITGNDVREEMGRGVFFIL